ncbi:MAG: hypothetical protein F4Z23_03885 [Acidimicrobiaceae bacterium]|nr:hypothetical protein [Acidimicrobiaceae bacterium]
MSRPGGAGPLELPSRSHQDFLALLAEVDAVLAKSTQQGFAYTLYTVGGFVLGRGSGSRLTQDIDVATVIPAPVAAAAAQVAARHTMNPAWLNDQVQEMIQVSVPHERFNEAYRGRHLIVYGADDELMLALKLMSGRARDISDIVDLAQTTGRIAPDDLLAAWDDVYGDSADAAPQRHFVESVIREDVMPALRRRRSRTAGRRLPGCA